MSTAAGANRSSTMRRDVLSAYAASGAKVLSWVIVSAIVFRAGASYFAVLALVRGTFGLLTYTIVGLAPALVRVLAEARARPKPVFSLGEEMNGVLSYARPLGAELRAREPEKAAYVSGLGIAVLAGWVGILLVIIYAGLLDRFHLIPPQVTAARDAAALIGVGVLLRLMSDAPAAVIQTGGSIARDSVLLIVSEFVWVLLAPIGFWNDFGYVYRADAVLFSAALGFAVSGLMLLVLRLLAAQRVLAIRFVDLQLFDWGDLRRLLGMGLLVAIAQLADFLYAPTDYILINRLISPDAVAYYAPAVQIDAGLLLLVTALAIVLLPKAAIAHTAGHHSTLRRYYVRGTVASAALLLTAGGAVYLLCPVLFRLWLGDPLPQTQAILPLVLVHTVIGGASGVGRSILLGMGKVKPFAIAALVAGATNVGLSYVFVRYFNLGLNGIVYGTIIAVIGRCVLWQPWYVLRTLRREAAAKPLETSVLAVPETPL